MKAMILAAGRGERMRPLTDQTPKPLLKAGKLALIEYHLYALANVGISEVIINIAHLGHKIKALLGDGSRYNVNIQYSQEQIPGLETAGGIYNALPLLGLDTFLVINADIYCDYPFQNLMDIQINLAHLVLVPNPKHHPNGDFHLDTHGQLSDKQDSLSPKYTYSGIGLYHPDFFKTLAPGRSPLAPLLKQTMQKHSLTGELYQGTWWDIGTPERLTALNYQLC